MRLKRWRQLQQEHEQQWGQQQQQEHVGGTSRANSHQEQQEQQQWGQGHGVPNTRTYHPAALAAMEMGGMRVGVGRGETPSVSAGAHCGHTVGSVPDGAGPGGGGRGGPRGCDVGTTAAAAGGGDGDDAEDECSIHDLRLRGTRVNDIGVSFLHALKRITLIDLSLCGGELTMFSSSSAAVASRNHARPRGLACTVTTDLVDTSRCFSPIKPHRLNTPSIDVTCRDTAQRRGEVCIARAAGGVGQSTRHAISNIIPHSSHVINCRITT